MKNLVIAGIGLIIVVIAIFVFTTKNKGKSDTIIPTPTPIESPALEFLKPKEATMAGNKKLYKEPPQKLSSEEIRNKKAHIITNKGEVVIEFFDDTPLTASNFIFLANEKFYDELIFHRVIKGFMIQGGDPLGNGTGGPGYKFADEKVSREYKKGIVAMANSGPNTNGSQFFIMHQDYKLPPNYTIFGTVVSGIEVVDKIANFQVDQNDKPLEPVVMTKVFIEELK